MFKNFFPNQILLLKNKTINNLIFFLIIIFIIGIIYSIFLSPPDYIQGDSVRIMYVHVPSSFIALICFGSIGIMSIINFTFKIKFLSLVSKSLAPAGFIFTLISIVTGSFWGKPTWGVWWAWDARLTSMLILLIFYLAYILSWLFIKEFNNANKTSSIIAIIGLFNLPIIKFSVNWWNTLHQPSSITLTSSPTIHYSMMIPLLLMFCAMTIYLLIIFLMKYKTEVMKIKINKKNNYK